MSFAHAGVRLQGSRSTSLPCDATRMTILSSGSVLLQGIARSSRRTSLDARPLSWGLCPYSAYRWEESTLLLPAVSRSADYGPSSGFLPSRRFTPPPTSPRLSTQQHSWGSPYRVFPSRTGPRAHHSQITLVALFPRPALSPPRKERTGGAKTGCLGAFRLHLLVAFRALLRSRVRTVREHD